MAPETCPGVTRRETIAGDIKSGQICVEDTAIRGMRNDNDTSGEQGPEHKSFLSVPSTAFASWHGFRRRLVRPQGGSLCPLFRNASFSDQPNRVRGHLDRYQ